jgi:diguanylate cyclase (GGDEF)-like protein
MKKLIDALLIKEISLDIFQMAFYWYNEIYSRKIELSDKDLNRIFDRIHTKAIKIYDHKIWSYLKTDDNKFWYSINPDKKLTFPLVPVLVNYGNAILKDRFPELAYPDNPDKATIEMFLFFIYVYVRSMKSKENVTTLLSPELIPSAIDPIVNHLIVHEEDLRNFNSLSVNLIIEILRLNNGLNQANKLKGLYNQLALNKIWERKSDDMIIGVIMLDADHFKQVNDKCGHDIGDEVLEIYGDSILKAIELSINLKTRAFPARWGGEEFCVCVINSNEKEIIDLSKKINSELKSHSKWEKLREKYKKRIDFPRTVSQGIALGKKSDFVYLNALEKKADEQAYKAKKNGRNCIYYKNRKIRNTEGTLI